MGEATLRIRRSCPALRRFAGFGDDDFGRSESNEAINTYDYRGSSLLQAMRWDCSHNLFADVDVRVWKQKGTPDREKNSTFTVAVCHGKRRDQITISSEGIRRSMRFKEAGREKRSD